MIEYGDGRIAAGGHAPGVLSAEERAVIRDLARRVYEIGNDPVQAQRQAFHRRNNALRAERPALLCFPEGAWDELVPAKRLVCTDPFWRGYELYLRRLIYRWDCLPDDFVTEAALGVPLRAELTGWGVSPKRTRPSEQGGAWRGEPVLAELRDWHKLRPVGLVTDEASTLRAFSAVEEELGDVIPVYVDRSFRDADPLLLETVCELRGMENLYFDMMDEEDELHALLAFLRDSWLRLYDQLESRNVFSPNTGNQYVGSGGVGFCDMPRGGADRPLKSMWGFCESQELASVSPEMYREFATDYYVPLMERFGLCCVGCCECLDGKLLDLARALPNLRRVSVSPWTDLRRAAQEIGGTVLLSWKPHPGLVSGTAFDEQAVKETVAQGLSWCRGMPMEIILKDVQTVRCDGGRLKRFLTIARQEMERSA